MFWDLVKAFIPLILLLGALYYTLKWVRKSGFNINGKKTNNINIKVLGSHVIMPRRFISVVKVENKILVLGVGESITLLKELDSIEPNDIEESVVKSTGENFIDILKKNLGMK